MEDTAFGVRGQDAQKNAEEDECLDLVPVITLFQKAKEAVVLRLETRLTPQYVACNLVQVEADSKCDFHSLESFYCQFNLSQEKLFFYRCTKDTVKRRSSIEELQRYSCWFSPNCHLGWCHCVYSCNIKQLNHVLSFS